MSDTIHREITFSVFEKAYDMSFSIIYEVGELHPLIVLVNGV